MPPRLLRGIRGDMPGERTCQLGSPCQAPEIVDQGGDFRYKALAEVRESLVGSRMES